jgi:hypothetical protein
MAKAICCRFDIEKGEVYVEPDSASEIRTNLTDSGQITFNPKLAPFMKMKATKDGGAEAAVLTLWSKIQ